jgi:HAD superfamily hydrolase (TIGR01549 family)
MVRFGVVDGCSGVLTVRDLAAIVAASRGVLLDFDGPVCHLFAGYPAPIVAAEMLTGLATLGVAIPDQLYECRSPTDVFLWVASERAESTTLAEDLLKKAELAAVETSKPTCHVDRVLAAAVETGRIVAIVSNNSAEAINRYLEKHGLASYVSTVVGRAYGRPDLMKPHPDSLMRASKNIGVSVEECLFVGDAVTDVHAAHEAGAHPIGYAKSPARTVGLFEAGAGVVIDEMAILASALRQTSLRKLS